MNKIGRPATGQKPYNGAYHGHKDRARRRGIDFQFSYNDWIDWWGNDIEKRGRLKGQLVMARKGDQGPYHPDNVYKATVEQNVKDALLGKPKSIDLVLKQVAGRKATYEQKKLIKETE